MGVSTIAYSARVAATLAIVFAAEVFGQQTGGGSEILFDINRFEIEGNTLIPAEEAQASVAPYLGKNKAFRDVRGAADALEDAFRRRGYPVVQVAPPEQDVSTGVIRLRAIQPKLRRVVVEGNEHFGSDNIRASLPSVREGETPNSADIARNLQLLAEQPAKQTVVTLRSGGSEDLIDASIRVVDEKPWRAFFTLDSTGTGVTGYYRMGMGYQHSNLFGRDHVLTAQYVTSPTKPSDVTIFGLGYRIPYYALNSSLELTAGYSDVNSGNVQGLFNVSGSGTIAGARWNWYLPKLGAIEQKLSVSADYRAFHNNVQFQGQSVVPDVTVRPLTLMYSGVYRAAAGEISGYTGLSHNLPGGNDGGDADFRASRAAATDRYTVARYGLNVLAQLPADWQARAAFSGQYTSNALVAGEQFGIGGPDSVRGYLPRELANDRGYSTQLELYTPDVAKRVRLSDSHRLRLLAFMDSGTLQRNLPAPGENVHGSISSLGAGIRWSYGRNVSMRLDLAHVLQGTATRPKGSQQLVAAVLVSF